jgi:hypothetical protein
MLCLKSFFTINSFVLCISVVLLGLEVMMEFSISTPALLFSAITILILAYTNRFLTLATLVRQHIALYKEDPDDSIMRQLKNFRQRIIVIKYTQIVGVLSFLFCVVSMFCIFLGWVIPAEIVFGTSLVLLFVSLLLSLHELFLSIGALDVEMQKVFKRDRKKE